MNLLSRVFEMVIGRESSKKRRTPSRNKGRSSPGEQKESNIVIAKETTNDEINAISNQCYNNDEKRD